MDFSRRRYRYDIDVSPWGAMLSYDKLYSGSAIAGETHTTKFPRLLPHLGITGAKRIGTRT